MKYSLFFAFLFSVGTTFFGQQLKNNATYSFYENKGQIIDQAGKENLNVAYLFQSNGLNVQIRKEGFSYDVYEVKKTSKNPSKKKEKSFSQKDKKREEYNYKFQYHRVDIDFVGANKNPEIIAEGLSPDYENYYNIPNKPGGITAVHKFQKIIYKNIYPEVDLIFFKPDDTLKPVEYNFTVNPGGKISDIQLQFKGAKTKLKDGKLCMDLRFGEMQENIPHSWEEAETSKNPIDVQFKDLGNGIFGFVSEKNVSDKTMVIDPVPTRIWGSYFGNYIYDNTSTFIETDQFNQVYFGGITTNPNYIATTGAHQTTIQNGTYDNGFIEKFNENGQRIWGTYIGNYLYATKLYDGIVGNTAIYVAGSTFDQTGLANNITTAGTHKEFGSANTREAFIMKLDFDGKRIWGTYYGGKGYEDIFDLNFDQNEDLLISGTTDSSDQITTPNSFIPNKNSDITGFFGKFSKTGQLLYGSYFYRPVNHITSDTQNNCIIAGQYYNYSFYPDIGTPGTHQPTMTGGSNGYILKFDSAFNKLWGTYYGGSQRSYAPDSDNYISGIRTDFQNNIIIAGTTTCSDFIATPGSHKEFHTTNVENGFIAKFLPNGTIDWGTYYGSEGFFGNYITTLFVNDTGEILVAGDTRSSADIATPNGYQPNRTNSDDGYFSKFSSGGSQVWGTYYSDMGQDELQNISYRNKHVYVIGYTAGYNFTHPFGTPGTFMPNGYTGYHLAKFRDCQNNVSVTGTSTVCPGSSIRLFASGGTSYNWTGPNGFSSSVQNPIIPNANAANNGTYICTISGTGDCDGNFSINVKVEDITAPVPLRPTLPTITGNCKTLISTIPTAIDFCAGNIVATTTDPLQYSLPGNYIIQWKYDDRNGNISTQNQNVTIVSEPFPTGNAAQNFCQINNPKVSDLQISGTLIKWYDATGNLLNANTLLVDGTKYYASQTLNGCESAKTEITVTVNDPIAPTGNASQTFCSAQMPKISDILVTGQNIKWFDVAGNFLPTTTPLLDGKTYFATQTVNGCESTQKLAVTASVKNGGIPANDYAMAICNPTTTNTKIENLDDYKDNLIVNPNIYIFEFFNAANQVISDPSNVILNLGANIFNVKIANNLGCFEYVKLTLTLDPKPKLDLPESIEFCNGQSVTLDAGGNGLIAYEWTRTDDPKVISNSQILVVNTPGNYILKVENAFGCQNSTIIKVTHSILAKIMGVQIVNNTATVLLSETGNFEYSLDQIQWQDSNIFTNLKNGNYTVHVRTKSGCIIGSENFSIFTVANVFTPDADGINDTWKISGLENYPGSEIKIFDRFGTPVLDKISTSTFEWDGTFNSRKLPSGNYWYVIKVTDGRLLQGWLLLKNRN